MKTAFFGAADALVSVHAFEKELGGADSDFGGRFAVDLQRRQLFEEPLNLLQLRERGGGGLCIVQLNGAAKVEPLLDLLGVGVGEVLVEDVATEVRMISRMTVSAPRISPSYSSSILPVIPGSAA